MYEIKFILVEILLILSFNILIFTYSAVSSEIITNCLAFFLFLILQIPFYLLLTKLEVIIFTNDLANIELFRVFFFYCNIINLFIGFFLVVQLIYLFITA
jgi:hypothetical protein